MDTLFQAREAKKKGADHMEVDKADAPASTSGGTAESKSTTPATATATEEAAAGGEAEKKEGEEKKDEGESKPTPPEPEPTTHTLGNPARVTPAQEPYVSFQLDQRYIPVRRVAKPIGIVMLYDRHPDEPEDVAQVEPPPLEGDEDEADPPEPFEWSPA